MLHQVEHATSGPETFPKVGRSETFPRGGIACATVASQVKRQETCFRPLKVRTHVDKIWINCEMGQAAAKGEKWFTRVTIKAVLLNGVLDILSCKGVLEFSSEDWQTIQEEDK